MIGHNFHHCVKTGNAFSAQTLNNSTVAGNAIAEPWRNFRQLSFLLLGGAFAASAQLAITVQGQKRADDAWEALKDSGGSDLVFDPAKLGDGDDIENGALLGTVPLKDVDTDTYKAVRLSITESGTANALIAVGYILSDPFAKVTGQADELVALL